MGGGEKFSRALAHEAVLGEHPGVEARGRGGVWVAGWTRGRKAAVRQSEGLALGMSCAVSREMPDGPCGPGCRAR